MAQCSQPGISTAGVASSHGLNANRVQKLIRRADPQNPLASALMPVALPAVPSAGRHIEIRLSPGPAQATVRRPEGEAGACVTPR